MRSPLLFLWLVPVQDSPFYSASFYPGQMVAGPSRAFKEAKWLSGMKPVMSNNTHVKAVVEEVS